MKPFARITGAGGVDITAGLGDRLLSVSCRDEAEDKSDSVTIRIDDRARWSDAGILAIPIVGSVLDVTMGYRNGAAARRGSYKIDSIRVSSPPREMEVTGRSADMPSKFRSPRSQSYHQKTVGEIVEDIAGRNGFSAVVDDEISGVVVRHIDQNRESDMSFATRLAAAHDAVAKPVDGKLVLARRGAGKSATGETIPPISLVEAAVIRWEFSYSARDEAGEAGGLPEDASSDAAASAPEKGGIRAFWTDIRTGKKEKVEVGDEPFSELRENFHNEAEAKAAASAKKNGADRGKCNFTAEFGGRVDVQAEAKLTLIGFRPYMPKLWRIKSAEHVFDGSGYTTRIDAELFQEKQKSVAKEVDSTKPTKDDKVDSDAPEKPTKSKPGKAASASPTPAAQPSAPAAEPGGEEFIIQLPKEV